MRHSRRAHHRKHNSSTSAAKANRRRGRKRNDATAGGSTAMVALKSVGLVALGAALALGGTLALSLTSLSAGAQDAILIGGGLVLGAVGLFGFKRPALAVSLSTGPVAVGLIRAVVRMNVMGRAEQVVASIGATTGAASTAAAQPGTAPGGWVTGTPGWTPQIAAGARMDSVANMTTPMVGYALG